MTDNKVTPTVRLNSASAEDLLAVLRRNSAPAAGGDCIEWTGHVSPNGYGRLYLKGCVYPAHRAAWVAAHGPMPISCDACHVCDNRRCVNPDHIFAGSRRANMKDAVNKGRVHFQKSPETMPCGDQHGRSKLTAEQAEAIRTSSGKSREIAEQFGVCKETVNRIRRGALWERALNSATGSKENV